MTFNLQLIESRGSYKDVVVGMVVVTLAVVVVVVAAAVGEGCFVEPADAAAAAATLAIMENWKLLIIIKTIEKLLVFLSTCLVQQNLKR